MPWGGVFDLDSVERPSSACFCRYVMHVDIKTDEELRERITEYLNPLRNAYQVMRPVCVS